MIDVEVTAETADLREIEDAFKEALRDGADAMAGLVMQESQGTVPVDSGSLKGSGRLVRAKYTIARVIYGGPAAPYAPHVEFNPDRRGFSFLRRALMGTARAQVTAAAAAVTARLRRLLP